jgi:DNA repair exonuclease SbcCD nuclease subunit
MNHYTFLHGADLHLGGAGAGTALPKAIRDRLKQESWAAFAHLLQTCQDRKIDFLLLAGDLFDHDRIRMTDLKAMASTFAALDHTRVFISPGNHDPMGGRLSYAAVDWPENVTLFTEESLTECQVDDWLSIWGLGWQNTRLDQPHVSLTTTPNLLKTNLLLIHGELDAVHSPYLPLSDHRPFLRAFDYVALGHIHKPSVQEEKLVYSGAPFASSFKDQGDRGYVKGHIQKKSVTHEFVSMEHIRFEEKDVALRPDNTWEEIRQRLVSIPSGDHTIYRIRLTGRLDPDLDITGIRAAVEGDFYHLDLVDDTMPDYDVERLYQENQGNIIGLFLRSMLQQDLEDPVQRMALFYGLEALLQGRER